MTDEPIHRTVFSPNRVYRYTLWREWASASDLFARPEASHKGAGYLMVIGLNPSTADETKDDPTIRRCIDFAKRWGFGALCMTNLFAFRATDPKVMLVQADPCGPLNDDWLATVGARAGLVLAAWGAHGTYRQRDVEVLARLGSIHCLGRNQDGTPRHPLYVPAITEPEPYTKDHIDAHPAPADQAH